MVSKNKLNLISLISIQASNAVLPIAIFPYLLNISGEALYAKIAIAEIFSIIVLAVVIYGFEINGVKKIIDAVDANDDLSGVFNKIFFSRLALFFASLVILPFVYLLYDLEVLIITGFWLLIPLSYILQNSYFFLAMQNNFPLACFNVGSRFLAVITVYGFIKNVNGGFYVPVLIGVCYLSGATATLIYLLRFYSIKMQPIKKAAYIACLSESFKIFLSNVSVLLYKDLNVIFLSLIIKDPAAISSYSLAEKFVKSFQALFRPISQYFFPKVVLALQFVDKPDMSAFGIVCRYIYVQVGLFLVALISLAVGVYLVLPNIPVMVPLLENNRMPITLFFVMSASILFGILNFMWGGVGLNILGKKGYFALCVLITGVVNIFVCIGLSLSIGAWGAALSFVLAEVVLSVMVSFAYLRVKT